MPNLPLLFSIILVLTGSGAFAGNTKSLQCGAGFADSFQLESITAQKLTVNLGIMLTGEADTYTLQRTTQGACKRHSGTACYLMGQMMVNLPKSPVPPGSTATVRVWLNMDIDDDPSNLGMGTSYLCSIH